jgi:hypothetical protein
MYKKHKSNVCCYTNSVVGNFLRLRLRFLAVLLFMVIPVLLVVVVSGGSSGGTAQINTPAPARIPAVVLPKSTLLLLLVLPAVVLVMVVPVLFVVVVPGGSSGGTVGSSGGIDARSASVNSPFHGLSSPIKTCYEIQICLGKIHLSLCYAFTQGNALSSSIGCKEVSSLILPWCSTVRSIESESGIS